MPNQNYVAMAVQAVRLVPWVFFVIAPNVYAKSELRSDSNKGIVQLTAKKQIHPLESYG